MTASGSCGWEDCSGNDHRLLSQGLCAVLAVLLVGVVPELQPVSSRWLHLPSSVNRFPANAEGGYQACVIVRD